MKLWDLERRLDQFQEGRLHGEEWGMGTKNESFDRHAGRGQSCDGADHSTDCAVSFQARNFHERVGLRHELRESVAPRRSVEMEQLNFRIRHALYRLQQWTEG